MNYPFWVNVRFGCWIVLTGLFVCYVMGPFLAGFGIIGLAGTVAFISGSFSLLMNGEI